MPADQDSIINKNFPTKEFVKIVGEPTYHIITDYEEKLQKNAISVKTLLTPNNLGFLPIVIGPTRYLALVHGALLEGTFPSRSTSAVEASMGLSRSVAVLRSIASVSKGF